MMYICERCHFLNENNQCLNCGKKDLRQVEKDDYCYLTEKEMMWCEMLKEVLGNYDIPYICESTNGAVMGLNLGIAAERYQIFIPFEYYNQAHNIMRHMFDEK